MNPCLFHCKNRGVICKNGIPSMLGVEYSGRPMFEYYDIALVNRPAHFSESAFAGLSRLSFRTCMLLGGLAISVAKATR